MVECKNAGIPFKQFFYILISILNLLNKKLEM